MVPEVYPSPGYGTVPSGLAGGSAQPYEFNSETLALTKTTVQGPGIHAGGLHNRSARRVLTNYQVAGSITMDLPSRYLNQLLFQMFGSKAQSGAALLQDATTGAYTGVHGPGTLQGTSMCIQKGVASVDGTAANPFTYVGMKMTDWEISVATGAIASFVTNWDGRNELAGAGNGDPLNGSVPALVGFNEAANNSVFHFRQATLYSGGTVGTAAIPNTTALGTPAFPATNVQFLNTFGQLAAVAITGGTISSVKINGVQVGTGAGTYGVAAGNYISVTYTGSPTWTWFPGMTTVTGNTAAGNVKSANIKYAFHLDNTRFFLGSNGFKGEPIENNFRDITGQFVVEWLNSEAMYNAFAADTTTTLVLQFQGPVIGSGTDHSSLTLTIPQVFLDGESPKVSGPAVVTQTVPFTGLEDGINNPIQAQYWTLDSV
jgi:hypothetical protein